MRKLKVRKETIQKHLKQRKKRTARILKDAKTGIKDYFWRHTNWRFEKPRLYATGFTKDHPELIRELTRSGNCLAPHIYLDNKKAGCNGCPYYEHCLSHLRKWSKKLNKIVAKKK